MSLTIDQLRVIHSAIVENGLVAGANLLLHGLGENVQVGREDQALTILRRFCQGLLDSENYEAAATLQWGQTLLDLRPSFPRRIFEFLPKHNKMLLQGAVSSSKCLGPDVPVMMFDGSIKAAKDVRLGDKLMGDDSQPRAVLDTTRGVGPLYRVTPERGEPWICNDAHILTMRVNCDKTCGSGYPSKRFRKDNIIDIPIKEYEAYGRSTKTMLKQFSVGIELPHKPVPFDPYIYGAWIGDGGWDTPALFKPDGPMAQEWVRYFTEMGYRISVGYRDTCPMWCARILGPSGGGNAKNPFTEFIRTSVRPGDDHEKFILDDYLFTDRESRLKLLAGLIDSDGNVANKHHYAIVTKWPELAKQIQWLAKSLGFHCTFSPRVYTIKSLGFSGIYQQIYISGNDIEQIPTRQTRATNSTSKKNFKNVGIKVEPIGEGEYCGFSVDGNHRFLLGDFTVTHNSYSAVAYFLLDYLRDPEYTAIKMIAVNESHLKANMFAHMLGLYRGCSIPMLDEEDVVIREADNYLGLKSAGNDFGIDGVATRQSKFGSGTIRGYKPKPYRKTPHPIWGSMTRLRILLDEGQHIPAGVFIDLNSPMGSMTENGLVKVAVCYNPVDVSIAVVQLAEPEQGWTEPDLDTLQEWVSKQGWNVLRLDAAQCENVIARKVIYPGFQTYEAYMSYMRNGDNSASYYVEARGFPPIKGAVNTVIPGSWVNGCWGEATFVGRVIFLVTVDLAYDGQDNPVMSVFRWGEASGWRRRDGTYIVFKDRLNPGRDKPRLVLQMDQQMTLVKAADTITIAEEIMSRCKELGVEPQNVAVDSTGMGAGTYSHLARYFGDVLGIRWGEKATGIKILSEDKEGSAAICDNNITEMWWTLRRWMDPTVGAVIINPNVQQNPLTTELTYRRYWNLSRGRIRVESKEEYKARQKLSPDHADSLVMAPQIVRIRLAEWPGIVDQLNRDSPYANQMVSHDTTEEQNPSLEYGDGPYASRLEN